MSDTTPQAPSNRRAPLAIWRAVHVFLTTLFHLFGAPEDLAARHTLTLKQHQLILPWLRAAEALMRRMLFIEAALVSLRPPVSNRRAAKMSAVRKRELLGFDAGHPGAWRVSFRCLGRSQRSAPRGAKSEALIVTQRARKESGGPAFRPALPLAQRMEALLRAFNNPTPYARRLAHRLRKTRALVTRFTQSWREHRNLIGHTLHDALVNPVSCGAAVFASDSS